jgi:hypothetical protein
LKRLVADRPCLPFLRLQGLRNLQALLDELLLFPQGEHDDLVDGLQTMMEGAMGRTGWGVGAVVPEPIEPKRGDSEAVFHGGVLLPDMLSGSWCWHEKTRFAAG